MKKYCLLGLVFLILIIGCGPSEQKVTVESEEGEVEITSTVSGSDWCPEGGTWAMTSNVPEQQGKASWKIDKLITSGKYAGLCHVIYTVDMEGEEPVRMDYYFSEDGKSGYYIMDIGGKKTEMTWSS